MRKIVTAQIREEIYYLLIYCGWFQEEQKGYFNWNRHIGEQLYTDQHIFNECKARRKNSYGKDWLQRSIWYDPTNQDNKLSQNVQDRQIHKLSYGMMENGIDFKITKYSWGKDPEKYISGRRIITITIFISVDATQPHTQEMHKRMKTFEIASKNPSPDAHRRHQTACRKKKNGNSNTGS